MNKHKMQKRIVLLCLLLSFAGVAQAQESDFSQLPIRQRLVFGGNFGAAFGSATQVNISPLIGYRVTERFTAGVGLIYMYTNYKAYNYKELIYGTNIFARLSIFPKLYLHGELELMNVEDRITNSYDGERIYIINMPIGIGYSQSVAGRLSVNYSILYNVNQSVYTPYRNPIIRIGIGI